jgi:hypothetical protein
VSKYLAVLSNVIKGAYVPIGALSYFQDTAFIDCLASAFTLLQSTEGGTYSKLQEQALEFIEQVHKSCLRLVLSHLPSCILTSIQVLSAGVHVDSVSARLNSANSILYLCEFVIEHSAKSSEVSRGIRQVLGAFDELLKTVLEVVLTEDHDQIWVLSTPLLGLIIVCESQFHQVKANLINSLTKDPRRAEGYLRAVEVLMPGVSRKMDARNKDQFSTNFSSFRQALDSFHSSS